MISPGWIGLAFMAIPVVVLGLILAVARLGQVKTLTVAVVRMAGQFTLLGFVLTWIFRAENPWITLGVTLLMLVASASTVARRQARGGWSLRAESSLTMGISLALVMAVAVRLSLRLEPWYAPRVFLPLTGMVLGNSVSAVALASERFASELRSGRDEVELRLALGAPARQAASPALRAAVRAGLTPILNNMMVAGIVSIPGMTTGQLLAGADVGSALRYQIMIYLAITATVGLSTVGLLALRFRRYFTRADQLRLDAFEADRAG